MTRKLLYPLLPLCLDLGLSLADTATAAETVSPPQLTLQASASQEVVQDMAYARFQVISEAASAAEAMQDANQRLTRALQILQADKALSVHSEGYTTQPRYQRDGKISGWQVSAGLQASTHDSARLADDIPKVAPHASLAALWFALSPARQEETENALLAQAIGKLQQKAQAAAVAAGYKHTELRTLELAGDSSPMPVMVRSKAMLLESSAAPPVEAGRQTVNVNVVGTLWLLK